MDSIREEAILVDVRMVYYFTIFLQDSAPGLPIKSSPRVLGPLLAAGIPPCHAGEHVRPHQGRRWPVGPNEANQFVELLQPLFLVHAGDVIGTHVQYQVARWGVPDHPEQLGAGLGKPKARPAVPRAVRATAVVAPGASCPGAAAVWRSGLTLILRFL